MDVDVVSDGRICVTEQLRKDLHIDAFIVKVRRKRMTPYMKTQIGDSSFGTDSFALLTQVLIFLVDQLSDVILEIPCREITKPNGSDFRVLEGSL